MKVAFLTYKERVEKYTPPGAVPSDWEIVHLGADFTQRDVWEKAVHADAVVVDAVLPVPAELIAGMRRLKLIHSEGVAFNRIDGKAAAAAGVYVCNNAGVNASAVAEQAILLMLAVQRRYHEGEAMVYAARQAEAKTRFIMEGLPELGDAHVGLVGFGAIGKETAKRLHAFGSKVSFYDVVGCPNPDRYHASFLPLEEIYSQCDIVSLHVPVLPETVHMVNWDVLKKMKKTAILINTARGELVDQEALCRALREGEIAGAGLDTLAPEPVLPDNPVINLPEELRGKIALSPHIAGTTAGVFHRSYRNIWNNLKAVAQGGRPVNIVNGL